MFELNLVMDPSLGRYNDLDELLLRFLVDIGYLPKSPRGRIPSDLSKSTAYRLFKECFVKHPEKFWTPEEMISYLGTTRTTLYRHLNRLKDLDILEESMEGKNKGYRLRYGSIEKAWMFVESNVKIVLEYYREAVKKIERLAREV